AGTGTAIRRLHARGAINRARTGPLTNVVVARSRAALVAGLARDPRGGTRRLGVGTRAANIADAGTAVLAGSARGTYRHQPEIDRTVTVIVQSVADLRRVRIDCRIVIVAVVPTAFVRCEAVFVGVRTC